MSRTVDTAFRLSATGQQQVIKAFQEVGQQGERALSRLESASQKPSIGLRGLNAATGELSGALASANGRLGSFGGILAGLGPIGMAVGAALATATLGITAAVNAAQEYEKSTRKMEGVLRATGQAAGLTGKEIQEMASRIDLATLSSEKMVLDASAKLLTFKSVGKEVFEETLMLAQDMAAVFGGDITSSVTQLGKALEDPVEGINALKRSGVTFTQAQRDMIESLVKSNDLLGAQRIVLDTLQGQIGGAGAAEAGGLAGAVDTLTYRWNSFLVGIGQTKAIMDPIIWTVTQLGNGFAWLAKQLQDATPQDQLRELEKLRDELVNRPAAISPRQERARREQLEALDAQIAAGREAVRVIEEKENADKRAAEAARQAFLEQQEQEKEVEEFKEKAKKAAEEREKAAKEAAAEAKRRADQAAKDRKAYIDGIEKQVAALRNERAMLGMTAKERAVHEQLLRAETSARSTNQKLTQEQIDLIRRETEATIDATEAERKRQEQKERAKRAVEEVEQKRLAAVKQVEEERLRVANKTTDDIVKYGAGIFDGWLNGERGSWQDFAADVKKIMLSTIAEIAAQAVIRPIVAPVVGSVMGSVMGGGNANASGSGGALTYTSDLSGVASLATSWGQSETLLSAGKWLATSSLGQSLGMSALTGPGAAQTLGVAAVPGGVSAAATPTMTGFGNAFANGLSYSPWGVIGSIGANLLGLGTKNPIGGTLGSVGGAALGSALAGSGTLLGMQAGAVLGPVGAVVGAFLGTALGGSIGGSRPHPAAHWGGAIGADGSFKNITAASKHMDTTEVQNAAQQLISPIASYITGALGGKFSNDFNVGFRQDDGKSGFWYGQAGSNKPTFIDFDPNDEEAAANAIAKLSVVMARAAENLPDSTRVILDSLGELDTVTKDRADAALSLAAWYADSEKSEKFKELRENFSGLLDKFKEWNKIAVDANLDMERVNNKQRQNIDDFISGVLDGFGLLPSKVETLADRLQTVRDAFAELTAAAGDNAEAIKQVTDAQDRAFATLRKNFEDNIRSSIQAIVNPMGNSIAALSAEIIALRKDADALGVGQDQIDQLWNAKLLGILQSQYQQAEQQHRAAMQVWENVAKSIRVANDNLLISDLSPLVPLEKLEEARSQMQDAATAAKAGDSEAASRFVELRNRFLQLSQAYNGDRVKYQADFMMALGLGEGIASVADQQLDQLKIANGGLSSIAAAIAKLEETVKASGTSNGLLANPNRNWGAAQNVGINMALAAATGYTADFGSGGFSNFISGASESVKQAARDVLLAAGHVPGFALGGVVAGGIPGMDSVAAKLMPGERVLTVEQNRIFEAMAQSMAVDWRSMIVAQNDNTDRVVGAIYDSGSRIERRVDGLAREVARLGDVLRARG